jgi:hypothetical protein
MTNANPFAAFQQAAAVPNAAQPVAPAASPFGAAPAQQPLAQQPVLPSVAAAPAALGALPDFGDIGESGRDPLIPEGDHILLFKANKLKTFKGHTVIVDFTYVQTTAPFAPGSTTCFLKKEPRDKSKTKTVIGYMLAMIRALAGYQDEATFKANVPEWSQILAACWHGDPRFAQWAHGRHVAVRGTRGSEIEENGKPTGRFNVDLTWMPYTPAA